MRNKIKILLVEDSSSDAEIIQRQLRTEGIDFDPLVVSTRALYEKALIEFQPEVVLCDHSLPQFNSMQAFEIFSRLNMKVPFILVTGSVSEEFAVASIKAGVDDYILKSSLKRLAAAVLNALTKKTAENEREMNYRKLQEVNEELKTFIYRSSHDIRQPVSSILGLIKLTQNLTPNAEIAPLIEMMDTSAKRLDSILLDLIQVIRIKDGKTEKHKINFNNLIKEVFDQVRFSPGFERIQFNINIDINNLFYSDKGMLVSMFQNLIGNCIKYQDQSIQNSFVNINIQGLTDECRIIINDNGVGIEAEYITKVFDMFYRGNVQSNGLGLGLYLTKNIVNKLGGSIILESNEKRGTTVSISLPCQSD
jgi:signal transduction histidine kinase